MLSVLLVRPLAQGYICCMALSFVVGVSDWVVGKWTRHVRNTIIITPYQLCQLTQAFSKDNRGNLGLPSVSSTID